MAQNNIPEMQNDVLSGDDGGDRAEPQARRSVERALHRRREVYTDEVRRLIEAGFDLIRAEGRLDPRVGAIVERAGLSNQTFYRHFRSKDELLLAVLDDGIRQLSDYLRHRMETADTAFEAVRRWIAGLCEQALQPEAAAATRPFALSRGRLAELFPEEVARSELQLTALLRDAIERAVAAGELPAADPERDAKLLYDFAMGWLQCRLSEATPARRADAEHLVEFALRGLRREPEGARVRRDAATPAAEA
jgi:AcrR family transcriptional regulator